MDPGHLTARNVLYVYKSNQWAVCVNGSWNYNSTENDTLNKTSVYSTPCGNNYNYADNAGGFVDRGSGWKGGYSWSGNHVLPASD